MPPDRDMASLADMAGAARLVLEGKGDMSKDDFMQDQKTQSAILHQLLIIGESVKRLSDELRGRHKNSPWGIMAGMRDHLIHGYDDVDLDEVWKTAKDDILELLETLNPLLPPAKDTTDN